MATKNIAMYSEKQYELDEIKDRIISYFETHKKEVADFRQAIRRELGEAKTMLLIFERYYFRNEENVTLVIQLAEFQGYQSADIFAAGGRGYAGENRLADFGIEALKSLGFAGKDI